MTPLSIPLSWSQGAPPVDEGCRSTYWCAIRAAGSTKVCHRFLVYCNRYVMSLSDTCYDPPKEAEPVPGSEGEDYYWTGWFEEACDQCDTQWCFTGEVLAWMGLPRYDSVSTP